MAELFSQRVQTTVQTDFLPYVVDTVLNSNVLAQRMMRAAKKWTGRKIEAPIKYQKNTTGTSFSGFDTFSTSATNNRVKMEFNPAFYQITCALPLDELSVANTDEAIINLMQLTIQSDTEDMADDLGTIFYADGTGNGSKDPLGLAALVDDGSTVATIGGLSRSTYTTLQSTVTASSGTISLAKVDTLWAAVTSGAQKPTAIYTTESVFNFYGQLLRPQERINKSDAGTMKGIKGGTGFSALDYMGVPVLMDEKCTSGVFFMLNENFLNWHALTVQGSKPIAYKSQIEGNDYDAPVGLGFSWSDWIKPANSASVVGHVYVGGQFVTTNPKRHGKLTGITGI